MATFNAGSDADRADEGKRISIAENDAVNDGYHPSGNATPRHSHCSLCRTILGLELVVTVIAAATAAVLILRHLNRNHSHVTNKSVECPAMVDPPSGMVSVSSNDSHSLAVFSCVSGYHIVGAVELICGDVGTWSDSPPTCVCDDPLTPLNGAVTSNGTLAVYTCDTGYSLSEGAERSCADDGSGWSGVQPLCVTCDTISSPQNGSVNLTAEGPTTVAMFSCSVGYSISGNSTSTCQPDGSWDTLPPICTDIDESKCNSVILGPDPGELSGAYSTCFYSLRADEGVLIELNLTQLDFEGRGCDEERIEVFKGLAGQSQPLITLCSFNLTGFIGIRVRNFFITYHHNGNFTSGGFKMAYRFVLDNFPPAQVQPSQEGDDNSKFLLLPAPVQPSMPSLVGCDNDCSGIFMDLVNGEFTYTTPTYQDNRQCTVVIKNTLFRNHVMEVKFVKFDLEESDNCSFDSLKIMAGEGENSAMLGGSHGKLYCGQELKGRTLTTNGNSLRLEFKTDESISFYGFKAVIMFVPNKVCECDRPGTVCVHTGMEKLCEPGSSCSKECQNGGKCVRHEGESHCVCRTGFSGDLCTQGEVGLELLEFVLTPEDREVARGSYSHFEECRARVVDGQALINYVWTFDGEQIGPYTPSRGFGSEPGGLLRFSEFNDQMEGVYSCIAQTESESRIEHFFEYKVVEFCQAGIDLGPKDQVVITGETVLFECYAPTAVSVVWKRNGRIINFNHNARFTKLTNNYLRIDRVKEPDAGTYRCEARSRTGCLGYREAELSVRNVTPLNSFCGITIHDEVSTRISKGRRADPTAYPWHVVLRGIKKDEEGEHTYCGGSLISQRYVLTSAFCIVEFRHGFNQDFGQNSVRMYMGSLDCYGTGGLKRRPAKVHVHDKYGDAAYQDSDIALIELSRPVDYTPGIRPVCLQEAEFIEKAFFGRMMMTFGKVAGCGKHWRKEMSYDLQEISIPFVDRLDCEDMFNKFRNKTHLPPNLRLTDQMFCAGNDVKNVGAACKGDAGGALVMEAHNRWIQTGIVSFGIGCDKGNYGIYTNVGKFYDWIKNITKFHLEDIEN